MADSEIVKDANGVLMLALKGDWTDRVEQLLCQHWEKLGILGVAWKDYAPLRRYVARIRWLSVAFGPDSSVGFSDLTHLEKLQLTDVLNPAVDMRAFEHLSELEILWSKKLPGQFMANTNLKTIIVHRIGTTDLRWLSGLKKLVRLELRGGSIASLNGIDTLGAMKVVRATELKKCVDVKAVLGLRQLSVLELDAPSAQLDDIKWLTGMPNLEELTLFTRLQSLDWHIIGRLAHLRRFAVSTHSGYSVSDSEIEKTLVACGRAVTSFKSFRKGAPGFVVEMETSTFH